MVTQGGRGGGRDELTTETLESSSRIESSSTALSTEMLTCLTVTSLLTESASLREMLEPTSSGGPFSVKFSNAGVFTT